MPWIVLGILSIALSFFVACIWQWQAVQQATLFGRPVLPGIAFAGLLTFACWRWGRPKGQAVTLAIFAFLAWTTATITYEQMALQLDPDARVQTLELRLEAARKSTKFPIEFVQDITTQLDTAKDDQQSAGERWSFDRYVPLGFSSLIGYFIVALGLWAAVPLARRVGDTLGAAAIVLLGALAWRWFTAQVQADFAPEFPQGGSQVRAFHGELAIFRALREKSQGLDAGGFAQGGLASGPRFPRPLRFLAQFSVNRVEQGFPPRVFQLPALAFGQCLQYAHAQFPF